MSNACTEPTELLIHSDNDGTTGFFHVRFWTRAQEFPSSLPRQLRNLVGNRGTGEQAFGRAGDRRQRSCEPAAMLILHIGRHKTGTSSIQHFLHANREELKKHGFIYPEPIAALAAHHGIALALKAGEDVSQYQELLRSLRPRKQNVLLSSEGFQRLLPRDMRRLSRGYPTMAVVYLREQFSYAWSAYAQKVCAGTERRSFEEALQTYVPKYDTFLGRWRKITRDNLKVRIFERKRLVGGDVVADFCQTVLGLDKTKFLPAPTINEALGWRSVNFMRQINECISLRPERATLKLQTLEALRQLAAEYPELMEKPHFPSAMREQYQALFVEQNKRIATEFLGTSDQPLFDLSWRGDSDWNTRESVTRRHVNALYERCPALRQFHEIIEFAAMA